VSGRIIDVIKRVSGERANGWGFGREIAIYASSCLIGLMQIFMTPKISLRACVGFARDGIFAGNYDRWRCYHRRERNSNSK
jgi:hypothetical protein